MQTTTINSLNRKSLFPRYSQASPTDLTRPLSLSRHEICFGSKPIERVSVNKRTAERFEFIGQTSWDFFAEKEGKKSGLTLNISHSGLLLNTQHEIEPRRWLRLVIQEDATQLCLVIIGRVVRLEKKKGAELSTTQPGSLYGVEFTFPNYLSLASTDVISALSKRNLMVRSCLNLNSKSPFRPGFLA